MFPAAARSGQVGEALGRPQRLEQRAGVVLEDVGHLAGREPGLDHVVALGPARTLLDLEGDLGMQFRVGRGQRIGLGDGGRICRNEHRQGHLLRPSGGGDRQRRCGDGREKRDPRRHRFLLRFGCRFPLAAPAIHSGADPASLNAARWAPGAQPPPHPAVRAGREVLAVERRVGVAGPEHQHALGALRHGERVVDRPVRDRPCRLDTSGGRVVARPHEAERGQHGRLEDDAAEAGQLRVGPEARHRLEQPLADRAVGIVVVGVHVGVVDRAVGPDRVPALPDRRRAPLDLVEPAGNVELKE